jgi:hypothetical protein
MTPRENLLRTIRCDSPEWIPIVAYTDNYNHPAVDSLPEPLAGEFREKLTDWKRTWDLIIPLSDYLGIYEYILPVNVPFVTTYSGNIEFSCHTDKETGISVQSIHTRSGVLEEHRNTYGTVNVI